MMDKFIPKQDAKVLELSGAINTSNEQGDKTSLKIGDTLTQDGVYSTSAGTTFVLQYNDGTKTSQYELANTSSVSGEPPKTAELMETVHEDQTASLQAKILNGKDPTTDLPDTAAGEVSRTANEGGDYVSVSRTGNETLANAGFDTIGPQFVQTEEPRNNSETIDSVNNPTIALNDRKTVAEDTIATGNVLANDSDVDNTLTVVSFEVNGETYAAGTTINLDGGELLINEDGSYTFTPNDNSNGTVPVITYTTNTGSTATLALEVVPVDDASVLVNDSNTIEEGEVATGNVLTNDSDVDNTLTVVSFEVNGETHAAGTTIALDGGELLINEDGSYTFTPNDNWNGTVPIITYTTNTGSTATLALEVVPVDDASVLVNDSNTIEEGEVATGNVLTNDLDVDNTLTVVSFEVNGETYAAGTTIALEGGELLINEDGSYTFTPNDNWNGTVPIITYTTNTGSTATLTLEVVPIDDASVLVNDSNTIAEDEVATGNVLTNDSDVDNTLTVVSFEVNGETHAAGTTIDLEGGELLINEDGSYTFTPNDNWNGTVPIITYTTNTGSTATLTLEVVPVDDASVLVNDSNTIAEDEVATGNVLTNDSDV
ncbi:retention module-containing protein, partial [Shewanella sairae]|uniref:retention module-containing protein n=2 Tax=Shewanella sairae TaxID=190310 RepID=UPI00200F3C17